MEYESIVLKDEITVRKIYTIHYFEYMKNFEFPGETHDFWELQCVDKGEIKVLDHVLKAGQVIFHKPMNFTTWRQQEPVPLQGVSRQVSYRDLKPGDLVFYLKYDTSGPIDHVGVYIGNNLMINASGHYGSNYPEGGITIKRIVYGNRRPALYKRLYGID